MPSCKVRDPCGPQWCEAGDSPPNSDGHRGDQGEVLGQGFTQGPRWGYGSLPPA